MIEFRDSNTTEWDAVVNELDNLSFTQSWQWGDVQNDLGHTAHRFCIYDDSKPVGLIVAVEKHAKRGHFIEIPGGPLLDWTNEPLVSEVLIKLRDFAKKRRCAFVRFRPQVHNNQNYRDLLDKLNLHEAPIHLMADHTSIVDLTPAPDEMLARMRQQTRYEVRRAPKRDVVVSVDSTEEMAAKFHDLQVETAKRQGFFPPHPKQISTCLHSLGDKARIYRADKNGQLLNCGLIIDYGTESAYFEAASTPESRREPGAYALIWQAMLDARERGMTKFNLWGTAPPNQPNHRFAGVTTFKHGFGGDNVEFVPAYDIVVNPFVYRLNHMVETIRKKRRNL